MKKLKLKKIPRDSNVRNSTGHTETIWFRETDFTRLVKSYRIRRPTKRIVEKRRYRFKNRTLPGRVDPTTARSRTRASRRRKYRNGARAIVRKKFRSRETEVHVVTRVQLKRWRNAHTLYTLQSACAPIRRRESPLFSRNTVRCWKRPTRSTRKMRQNK